MNTKYTKLQWFSIFIYSLINTFCGISISLQAPFYPMVAQRKGATPSQYATVFGIFYMALFFMCILVGGIISKFGAKKVGVLGLFIIGSTNILFGFVDEINTSSLFIAVSVIIRIFEGIGYAMARNATIAVITFQFSAYIETAFAFIQAFFFAGLLIGPVFGGALFEIGGFMLPFTVIGTLLLFSGIAVIFLPTDSTEKRTIPFIKILAILRTPSSVLGFFVVFGAYMNDTFVISILEPHLQILNLSPFEVGLMFLFFVISLTISTFAYSKFCEKYDIALRVSILSGIFNICSFMVLGPAPYLRFNISIITCIFGIITLGIGAGGGQVSGFSTLNKSARIAGFPQSIQTSGIVSSIYTSALSLGGFAGPVIGGYLFDIFDFPWASHFLILYNLVFCLVILVCLYIWGGDLKVPEDTEILILSEQTSKYDSLENN